MTLPCIYQYSCLHEFQYDSWWLTLGAQYGKYIEMNANCYVDDHI